jgi:hypothetical protein
MKKMCARQKTSAEKTKSTGSTMKDLLALLKVLPEDGLDDKGHGIKRSMIAFQHQGVMVPKMDVRSGDFNESPHSGVERRPGSRPFSSAREDFLTKWFTSVAKAIPG